MPASPTPDLMDSLALFSHGEFLDYDNENPELLLFSHGEFPRPGRRGAGGAGSPDAAVAVGSGRRRSRICEPVKPNDDAALAIAILAAAEDDDWW